MFMNYKKYETLKNNYEKQLYRRNYYIILL